MGSKRGEQAGGERVDGANDSTEAVCVSEGRRLNSVRSGCLSRHLELELGPETRSQGPPLVPVDVIAHFTRQSSQPVTRPMPPGDEKAPVKLSLPLQYQQDIFQDLVRPHPPVAAPHLC